MSITFSHEVKLTGTVRWLAVCSDTRGFAGNRSHIVVRAHSARQETPLPQVCIIVSFYINKNHLLVLPLNGKKKYRCICQINWEKHIWGLHCDRQLVYIAQHDAVTVTDLSGLIVRQICPHIKGFGGIRGIGGNAASVFVSSGNKIVAFSKATGQLETVITLSQLPDARLGNLAIHNKCILVTDWEHNQVHRVRLDTQQLLVSHPTQRAGLHQFALPVGVAVDSRGRLFVSEYDGHSVRAVAADDESLLWTLGVPGESGSGDGRPSHPWGLAVVMVGTHKYLVTACDNRLLVFNA